MIKFLILSIIFFLLYILFGYIGKFDSPINLVVYDYQIETSFFVFIALFFITQFFLTLTLKVVFTILNFSAFIRNKLRQRQINTVNKKLLQALTELLIGHKEKAVKIINEVAPRLEPDDRNIANLIIAEGEQAFDKKIQYYKNIINKKNYGTYAAKQLARILYQNSHHLQAEEYALKAFSVDDSDPQLIILLIKIYASLGFWPKLLFVVSKLQRSDPDLFKKHSEEIASYYYIAAKHYLRNGKDDEAIKYLESALEFKPDYLEALSLYMEIAVSADNSSAALKILKNAFSISPSFEIARMFIDTSETSPEAIYNTLTSIVHTSKFPGLFLSIAAYLGLHDKIALIKEPKLITYDSVLKKT